ncbi:MAG: glycosyltransferase family 9 protein [Candidatus Omnitrophota bacterium]
MRIDKEAVKNILVLRNDRFGEFLLNIPALCALKETFRNARLTVVVDPCVKELAERVAYIDEIIEWGRSRHPLSEKIRLISVLREKKVDIAVMLNPDRDFNIIAYIAGIPVRVGYNRKWGFLLTHKKEDRKYLGERHEVEYNLEMVSSVSAHAEDRSISLSIRENDIKDITDLLSLKEGDKMVAVHPWTSDDLKQWPAGNFRELSEGLSGVPGIKVVIVGGKEEAKKSAELFRGMDNRIVDLTGKTTLIQLAALLKKCELIISGDSGPVHLACAVGIRAIVIFRNDIPGKGPKRWGPWGNGNIVIEKNNLAGISATEVLNKAKEALIN